MQGCVLTTVEMVRSGANFMMGWYVGTVVLLEADVTDCPTL